MHDLEGWDEVGSLCIESVENLEGVPPLNQLPDDWQEVARIEKQRVSVLDYFESDSGLRITNESGEFALISSAAAPYEIAIDASFFQGEFRPEYDPKKYGFLEI